MERFASFVRFYFTLASSNLVTSICGARRLADSSETQKRRKYLFLTTTFHFSFVCVETLGVWGSGARELVRRIGFCVMEWTGDSHATQF